MWMVQTPWFYLLSTWLCLLVPKFPQSGASEAWILTKNYILTWQNFYSVHVYYILYLGDTQYTVWSTRSSDMKKLAIQVFLFFFFSSDMQEKQWCNYKKRIIHRDFVYFHDKKLSLEHLFYFFPRYKPDRLFYFLFFFLRWGQKDPCRSSSTKQYIECRFIRARNYPPKLDFLQKTTISKN